MMDKREALQRYIEHKSKGLVDQDIIPLLDKINSLGCCYTTSSCSGRIAIMEIPKIGDKVNARFLGKWHTQVDLNSVQQSIGMHRNGFLFFLVQSAIIHIVCDSPATATKIINIARDSGFKYTSIKSIKSGKYLVEVLSTENLQIPIGRDGKIFVGEKSIKFFVMIANEMLERVKTKLKILEKKINSLEASFCT